MKEVVIKMSDEMYDWFINGFPDKADMDELQRLVITGTVLPKGHGDLVDRDEILDYRMNKILSSWSDAIMYADAIVKADRR